MSFKPKCPNHTVQMDKTDDPRKWICPVSGAIFDVDVEQSISTERKNKWGELEYETIILHNGEQQDT